MREPKLYKALKDLPTVGFSPKQRAYVRAFEEMCISFERIEENKRLIKRTEKEINHERRMVDKFTKQLPKLEAKVIKEFNRA